MGSLPNNELDPGAAKPLKMANMRTLQVSRTQSSAGLPPYFKAVLSQRREQDGRSRTVMGLTAEDGGVISRLTTVVITGFAAQN